MFDILLDGISILNSYKEGIVVFFVAATGFGYLTIKQTFRDEVDTRFRPLVYLCIGSITLCIACYILLLLAYFWHSLLQPGSHLLLLISILVLIHGLWKGDIRITRNVYLINLGLLVFLLLIMRLSFLKHIILPSYSDSPIHYQIVFGLLHPEFAGITNLSLGNIFENYYHFGFHTLVAWLTVIARIDPVDAISLIGQIFLVIAPLSVILLVYILINSRKAALFSGLLTAIGWAMPAFAINWGKFPALISLATVPAFIAFASLYLHNQTKSLKTLSWGIILLISIILIHTRIAIFLLLVAISYFVSNKIRIADELGFSQCLRLSILYLFSLLPLSQLVVNFYLRFPLWIIFLILLPYAFQAHPKLSVGIFFCTTGLWLTTLIPHLIYENDEILLDRQFLEMILYIPFSVLGGAGFHGITKNLSLDKTYKWAVAPVLVGCVIYNFQNSASLYPDSCCEYFKENDQLAFRWLQENTTEHSLVIISSFSDNNKIYGTDAGIWIFPLLRINTNKLPFNTIWHSPDVNKEICNIDARETYIYMGGTENSFANAQLVQEMWIKPVYKSGKTEIYQVLQCE